MGAKIRGVEHPCVRVEHVAENPPGPHRIETAVEGLRARPVHSLLPGSRRSDDERAHEGRVVVAPGAGELQGELITGPERGDAQRNTGKGARRAPIR